MCSKKNSFYLLRKKKYSLHNLSRESTRCRIFQEILNGFHSNECLSLQFLIWEEKNTIFFKFHQKVFFLYNFFNFFICPEFGRTYRVKYFSFNRDEIFLGVSDPQECEMCLPSVLCPHLNVYVKVTYWFLPNFVYRSVWVEDTWYRNWFFDFFLLFLFRFWTLKK